jgi:hypothetical protein
MKKFLLLYMSPVTGEEQMKMGTPEEKKKGMEAWTNWYTKLGSAVVDPGNPLSESVHVGHGDHPKLEAHVGGYTVIQAETMEKAKELVSNHPQLSMPNSCIEVLEMLEMPKM